MTLGSFLGRDCRGFFEVEDNDPHWQPAAALPGGPQPQRFPRETGTVTRA
jgi:hypothetical protein